MQTEERIIYQGRHSCVSLIKHHGVNVVVKRVAETQFYDNELVTLLTLGNHPHIIEFIRADCGRLMFKYYPMDLFTYACDYVFLDDHLRTLIAGVCAGLEFMHSRCIAHGDVKLENVLVDNGVARLCDFGYSHTFVSGVRTKGVARGSYHYISPQVLQGQAVYLDKVDVWALGVMIYALFNKTYPYPVDKASLMSGGPHKAHLIAETMKQPPMFHRSDDCAADLCRYLLTYDDDIRPSMSEVVKHKWFLGP